MPSLISTLKNGKAEFYALLWKRMSEKGDFPALSKSVHDLAESMQEEDKSITDVTGAILSDFTLTQKVIRLANSAMYAGIGGEITTVTKAAMVLGLDAISHLALSVRFIDTLSASSPDSVAARAEMAKALVAGDIARNVAAKANLQDGEEAVVCALMHHLGRLLLAFYFPEEWAEIQRLTATGVLNENMAAMEVIGVTLDDISQEAAKSWRLPKKIASTMVTPPSPGGTCIPGSPEWLKALSNFATDAALVMARKEHSGSESLHELAARYGDTLLVSAESMVEMVRTAAASADDFSMLEKVEAPQGKPENAGERLAVGVLETTRALSAGMSFGNALNLVLETMYGGMGFNRVVAFLRDGENYKGKVGFGDSMPEALPRLRFPEAYATDVFHLALTNKADVFIEDASGPKSAASMPVWFTEALPDVRAFVLLPLTFNGHAVGLLYGDWSKGTTGLVEKSELLLLRSLRDHLMKQLGPKKS